MTTLTQRSMMSDQQFRDVIDSVTDQKAAGVDLLVISRNEYLLHIYDVASPFNVITSANAAWNMQTIRYSRKDDGTWMLNTPTGGEKLCRVSDRTFRDEQNLCVTHLKAYRGHRDVIEVVTNFLTHITEFAHDQMSLRRVTDRDPEEISKVVGVQHGQANELIYRYFSKHSHLLTDIQLIELCHQLATQCFNRDSLFVNTVNHDFI